MSSSANTPKNSGSGKPPRERFPLIVLHWRRTKRTPAYFKLIGIYRAIEDKRRVIEFAAGRFCKIAAALGLCAYLAAGALLYFRLDSNPRNQVAYADLVLPWRWGSLSEKRGLSNILAGIDAYENGNTKAALINLRNGLARVPGHTQGRMMLARIYFMVQRPDLGFQLLEDGLNHGLPDDEYLNTLLASVAGNEYYEMGLRVADRISDAMKKEGRTDWDERLRQFRLETLMKMERYDELLAEIQSLDGDAVSRKRLQGLEAMSLAQEGRRAEAIEILEKLLLGRKSSAPPLRLLAELYRVEGNLFGMADALRRLLEAAGDTPETRGFIVSQWYALGDRKEVDACVGTTLSLHGSDIRALGSLSMIAEAWNDEGTIRRCLAEAHRRGLSEETILISLATQQLKTGQTAASMETLAAVNPRLREISPSERMICDFLRMLGASIQNTQSVPPELVRNHMQAMRIPLAAFVPAYHLVRKVGGPVPAVEVLKIATSRYPFSRRLSTLLEDASTEAGAVSTAASNAAEATARNAGEDFNDSEAAGARLEKLRAEGGWGELAATIAALERVRPAWFLQDERQWRLVRIEALLRSGRTDDAAVLIRMYRDGSNRADHALDELAGRLEADGMVAAAARIRERPALVLSPESSGRAGVSTIPFVLPDNLKSAISQMQGFVNAAEWEAAGAFFQQLERARPAWFDPNAPEWTRLRLRLAVTRNDEAQIAAVVQIHLLNRPDSGPQLMALACRAFNEGDRAGAIFLAGELVRRFPKLKPDAAWAAEP